MLFATNGLRYYIDISTYRYFTTLSDGVPTNMNRSWIFVGFTYDPVTQKAYAFLDNQYTEMTKDSSPAEKSSATKSQWFGGHAPFLVDNVFYFPKFSTAEEISAIYETSMFILN